MPSLPPALHAEQLGRAYGPRWALAAANVHLEAGDSLLVAGHNGAGKSTLLRMLATVLRPSRGSLRIFGLDADKDAIACRHRLGLLGHSSYLYGQLSARENLETAGRILGLPEPAARVDELLDRVGLLDRGDDAVATFSAGMKKRLSFGHLLLQDPDLLLLDEPYGQLDVAGFAFVDDQLRQLREAGKTVVLCTHLVERAAPLLQSGLVLHQGLMRWVGPASGVPEALAEVLQA